VFDVRLQIHPASSTSTAMKIQKLVTLLTALLMTTQSPIVGCVVDDVTDPCPLSCSCYRQVSQTAAIRELTVGAILSAIVPPPSWRHQGIFYIM